MSDLISRQAAIDHWRLIIDATNTDSRYNMGFVDGLEFCISHLSTMPSAQPDKRLSKIADLVEGTIDHFDLDDAMDLLYQIKDALDGSDELPSAQPEIIRCKDCRKHNISVGYKEDCCALFEWRGVSYGHEHDYQYCCHAERRADE